jgi:ketosteroid isomerase-like protein
MDQSEMTHSEAQAFFDDYAAAFSARDMDAIADAWTYPCLITQSTGAFAFADRASFHKNITTLDGFYARQGVAKASGTVRHVTVPHDGVAIVEVDYELSTISGARIIAWPTTYTLRRDKSGAWKACFAIADGEIAAWAARGTPLGAKN